MFWNFDLNIHSNIALVDSATEKILTYKEFTNYCNSIEAILASHKKSLAFIYIDNSLGSIIAYLSLLRSGHACALIDKRLNVTLRQRLIRAYKPEFILSTSIERIHHYEQREQNGVVNVYHTKRKGNHPSIHKDLALLLSTSGSTGSPKFVRLSYNNIQANAESIAKYLNITSHENAITSLPLAYSFGLSVLNSHLLKGGTVTLTNQSFVLRDFWDTFNYYNCTSFSGVPYSYTLLEKIHFEKINVPTLKIMTQAGGRLSNRLQRKYNELGKKRGFKFFIMYGQTEATARMSYLPTENIDNKIGSIGIPIPGGQISIINGGHDVTNLWEEGEIVYKGENVMMGYAEKRKDLHKGDEVMNVLYTGDIGYRDSDGFYFITGRKKRFIKLNGSRFNLDELENFIELNFDIQVLCAGIDDNLKIALKTSDVTLLAKVKNKVSHYYNVKPALMDVNLVSNIPLNISGKPNYKKLLKSKDS